MSSKIPLSEKFMDTMPYIIRTKRSKQKQIEWILLILKHYPDQFEEFINKFGKDRYSEIIPKC